MGESKMWDLVIDEDWCFFIAEIGVNHDGSIDKAKALIDVAVKAGADAVKFQTFFAAEVASTNAKKAEYQIAGTGPGESQLEMLRALELSPSAHRELQAYCVKHQIRFLSTPFSERAADLLLDIGVDGFKVSSGDLTHIPLLRKLGSHGLPVILSTGMGTLGEVAEAVSTIHGAGCNELALLHCVSRYPAEPADCNLRAMAAMSGAFQLPVGWSDHTKGDSISLAAVALGARIIEKHFTLDRNAVGPDHSASLEPSELINLVSGVRDVQLALGSGVKRPTESEGETARAARRSLVAARDLEPGTVIDRTDLAVLRPGTGIEPSMLETVCGLTVWRQVLAGQPISWAALYSSDTHSQ